MSLFVGLGLLLLILPYSIVIIFATDGDVYKTLAGNLIMIAGNITLTILYVLGTIFEVNSIISYICGIIIAIIMNLSIKVFLLTKKRQLK